jgi:hypothetical protein
MLEYPRALYRPGIALKLDGVEYDVLIVRDEEAREEALDAGWSEYDDLTSAAPKGPLDRSVKELAEYLAAEDDLDEVRRLLSAEKEGKTRAGAIAVLEARRDELK